jgi:hypothetical protein|tara:strand:+ start:4457 stop:4927 length:471 start_codon:yes stop_codon:yes gene_type:complete
MINVNKLRRDVRAKHYKPLCMLIVLDYLDQQKVFSPVIPGKQIINKFEFIMNKLGYRKEHNKGFMPFWHITGDDIWNCYSKNHHLVSRNVLQNQKKVPKTKKQLLRHINYALINQTKIDDLINQTQRNKFRKKLLKLIKNDQDKISKDVFNYFKKK